MLFSTTAWVNYCHEKRLNNLFLILPTSCPQTVMPLKKQLMPNYINTNLQRTMQMYKTGHIKLDRRYLVKACPIWNLSVPVVY